MKTLNTGKKQWVKPTIQTLGIKNDTLAGAMAAGETGMGAMSPVS
jgi:hypothetical protein